MKYIPNTITCLNLVAGCMACVMALRYNNYDGAFYFVALAAVFDFLDGFAARLLHFYSKLGAELDSLADIVSFGLAPACILFSYLSTLYPESDLPLVSFAMPVFAALRLAKFNIDTRQTTSFLGLPVPAAGLFFAALIPSLTTFGAMPGITAWVLVLLVCTFGALMVSEIPMFSLKFKHYRWQGNEQAYLLIAAAVALFATFTALGRPLLSISLSIVVYILLSAFGKANP